MTKLSVLTKPRVIWLLAAANVALAATLAWRGIDANRAIAQPAAMQPGKYVMVPGSSQLGVSIIYLFDSANRRIGAIAPDARESLNAMPTLELDRIFRDAENPAGPAVNPNAQGGTPARPVRPSGGGPGTR